MPLNAKEKKIIKGNMSIKRVFEPCKCNEKKMSEE